MNYLLTGSEMKQCDANTMEHFGMLSAVLMERASLACAQCIMERFPSNRNAVLVACGSGNNGGDGIVVARLLWMKGYNVTILFAGNPEHMTEETSRQYKIAENYHIPITTELPDESFDIIVDALFGIGLCRPVSGSYAELIRKLNQLNAFKFAVDIPSGISADNGAVLGVAFRADLTVTMGFAKIGNYLYPGSDYTGTLVVADIGIDEHSLLDICPGTAILHNSDLKRLPCRKNDSNKGTYGKLLIIAGSHNMAGACAFSALAAYRTGAGLVKILTPEINRLIIQSLVPEAVLTTYDDETDFAQLLNEELKWATAVVIGPGLGTSNRSAEMVSLTLEKVSVPLVIDADALNLIASHKGWKEMIPEHTVITPHLGEMSRLIDRPISVIKENLIGTAKGFSEKYGTVTVLKDARTITAVSGSFCYLNTTGNHGMSTGGSGDVLTGIIGGLLAQNTDPQLAAPLGVWIHGSAGDFASAKIGKRSLIASDLIQGICEVWKETEE